MQRELLNTVLYLYGSPDDKRLEFELTLNRRQHAREGWISHLSTQKRPVEFFEISTSRSRILGFSTSNHLQNLTFQSPPICG